MTANSSNEQAEIDADLLEAERFGEGIAKFTSEGVEADADYLRDFEAFIAGLGLQHFSASEFLFLGGSHYGNGRCGGLNAVPPPSLWNNIEKTALVLDKLRSRLGVRIRLTSIYRTKEYNTCLSGTASNSFHMQFKAADFQAGSGTPTQWRSALREIRDDGAFQGGIGLYSTFVHVDTGPTRDWNG